MRTMPILFKSYMSRALLDDAKTETRRLQETYHVGDVCWVKESWSTFPSLDKLKPTEIWKQNGDRGAGFRYEAGGSMAITKDGRRTYDPNSDEPRIGKLRPSLFLPTFGSRQTIVMKRVIQEQLHDITDEAAIAEGIRQIDIDGGFFYGVVGIPEIREATPRHAYFALWDLISGAGAAAKNPDVFVFKFEHFPINLEDHLKGLAS